ncbi:MAG TPA: dTDP-4-dehydrorhamnose 3,5-epimerase [Polyangiales bacterium]|nr:dTDP-4-dehydrorhamnose 3,5-epimerase [Polyangiales bacterium]
MLARATKLPGLLILEPKVYSDPRGYFFESWSDRRYAEHGVPTSFVQDNVSRSTRGTLRGLHLQAPPMEQGKLVSVLDGEVFDVVVDVRPGSPSFGQWLGETLSASNARQLYVPPGFAHGFCVLSESALFAYKCTQYYSPQAERALRWNDPEIGIAWPLAEPLLSDKDAAAPSLRELVRQLKQEG